MAYISFFLPLRIRNKDHIKELYDWFYSVVNSCNDPANIEVIAKVDDNDPFLQEIITVFKEWQEKITVKYLVSPQGGGYKDISKSYMDLLFLLDKDSKMIMAGSVDMRVVNHGIDTVLLEASKKYDDDIFVCHLMRMDGHETEVKTLNLAVQVVENFPVWSRRWIEIQGHFGYNALNDGYTGLVEFFLSREWGIDRRIDLTEYKFLHEINKSEVNSSYWQGVRRAAMESHLSEVNVILAKQSAKNLALNIINPIQRDSYISTLIRSILDVYDQLVIANGNIYNMSRRISKLKRKMRLVWFFTPPPYNIFCYFT